MRGGADVPPGSRVIHTAAPLPRPLDVKQTMSTALAALAAKHRILLPTCSEAFWKSSWCPASPSMVGHREGLTINVVRAGLVMTWEGGAAPGWGFGAADNAVLRTVWEQLSRNRVRLARRVGHARRASCAGGLDMPEGPAARAGWTCQKGQLRGRAARQRTAHQSTLLVGIRPSSGTAAYPGCARARR